MSGKEEGVYMIRKKFYVPKGEISRDYRRFSRLPADFLFPCDYDEVEENDES